MSIIVPVRKKKRRQGEEKTAPEKGTKKKEEIRTEYYGRLDRFTERYGLNERISGPEQMGGGRECADQLTCLWADCDWLRVLPDLARPSSCIATPFFLPPGGPGPHWCS